MNNILLVNTLMPHEVARHLADRVRQRRLDLDLTQEGLATRAGLKFATYRRFEQSGDISLRGLLQIAFALNALPDFEELFGQPAYRSIDDAINRHTHHRKRGSINK